MHFAPFEFQKTIFLQNISICTSAQDWCNSWIMWDVKAFFNTFYCLVMIYELWLMQRVEWKALIVPTRCHHPLLVSMIVKNKALSNKWITQFRTASGDGDLSWWYCWGWRVNKSFLFTSAQGRWRGHVENEFGKPSPHSPPAAISPNDHYWLRILYSSRSLRLLFCEVFSLFFLFALFWTIVCKRNFIAFLCSRHSFDEFSRIT